MPVAWPLAGELMTARPVTLPHDAPISRALGLMRSRRIHEIPILQGRRLLGMITFETIARRSSRSVATKVGHLLVVPPLVTPAFTLPEVAAELLATGLRAAPVVGRRGELLGVISRTDLVRALAGPLGTGPGAGREDRTVGFLLRPRERHGPPPVWSDPAPGGARAPGRR